MSELLFQSCQDRQLLLDILNRLMQGKAEDVYITFRQRTQLPAVADITLFARPTPQSDLVDVTIAADAGCPIAFVAGRLYQKYAELGPIPFIRYTPHTME